jgi:His/Glu/Gln/Arg/opine family amino acid ABC transporter permease subunit
MQNYTFNWSIVVDKFPVFLSAVWIDLWLAAVSFVMAVVVGLIVATSLLFGPKPLRWVAFVYVQIARGVPIYLMLFWVYFGLASALSIPFTAIQAALIALTLAGSGYTTEAMRAGVLAVSSGQSEAASSLGLSTTSTYFDIVLPQAIRYVLPPLASIFLIMTKWSTLVSAIAVVDMIFLAKQATIQEFTPFESYFTVALVFVIVVGCFSFLVGRLERFLRVPS